MHGFRVSGSRASWTLNPLLWVWRMRVGVGLGGWGTQAGQVGTSPLIRLRCRSFLGRPLRGSEKIG